MSQPSQALNDQRILDAAIMVLNAEGIERLTIRKLASVLGIKAASLD